MHSNNTDTSTPVDTCSSIATVSVVAQDKTKPHRVRLANGSCALVSRNTVKKTTKPDAFKVGVTVLCDIYERSNQLSVVRRLKFAE